MEFNIRQHLPEDFSDHSKVWIYQSSRQFQLNEALDMEPLLEQFLQNWKSHGHPVKGYANLFFGRFLVIMADETQATVGGCSTDSSVRLVKELGQRYGVDFFNRELLAFHIKNKVEVIPLAQFQSAIENGFLNQDSLYFNNTVLTKKEIEEKWIIPLKNSWLKSRIANLI